MRGSAFIRAVNPLGLAVILAIVLVWQLVVGLGLITFNYLPAPTEIVVSFVELLVSGEMIAAVLHTVGMALVAAVIAIILGTALGAALALVPAVRTFSLASVDFLRSIPAVALMPVFLLLLGPSAEAEILVAAYAALWPMLINTLGGVRAINPRLGEVARTLQIGRSDELRKIIIPSAVPSILVGARLSIVTALVVVIIAEMMVNPEGIGWALVAAQQSLRPDILFAYAIMTGILGLVLNELLVRTARGLMPGSPALRELS